MDIRIYQLDGLRIIFTIIIFISHQEFWSDSMVGKVYSKFVHNPTMAVDYFFMLSGFGLYLSSTIRRRDEFKLIDWKYAKNKISKIYSIYIISLLAGAFYTIISGVLSGSTIIRVAARAIICLLMDLTMLQSLTGMTSFSHSLNGVCWFISTLFICYMFAPYLVRMVDKIKESNKIKHSIIFTAFGIIILSYVANGIDSLNILSINDIWYGHPVIRIWYVFTGMLIAAVYRDKQLNKAPAILEYIISIIAVIYYLFRNSISFSVNIVRLFDIVLCSSFLLIFSFGSGRISSFLSKPSIVKAGRNSMYIYLLHYPIRRIIGTIFNHLNFHLLMGEWTYLIETFLIIIFTLTFIFVVIRNKECLDEITMRFYHILKSKLYPLKDND